VLKDGRFFIAGGEYLTGYNLTPPTETNHAALEIYDPVANVWARQPDSPLGGIGDVAYQILTDGRILMGYRFGAQVEIFNPATGTWSTGPNKGAGSSTEETWSLLPNGTVLNWVAPQPQLYLPASNSWVNATTPPVAMQNTQDLETGPAVFLPTGKLVAFGAFGNLALYTPGPTTSGPGSWTLGPSAPPPAQPNTNPNHSQYMEDVPACIEPNGKVLFVSSDEIFGHGNRRAGILVRRSSCPRRWARQELEFFAPRARRSPSSCLDAADIERMNVAGRSYHRARYSAL